jgi:hypothetical protein
MQGVNFPLVRTGLLPVLAAGLAIGCARAPRPVVVSAPAVRPGITSYDGVVKVDPGVGAIDARWRIALSAEALRGDSVSFLLNEGLAVARLGGADVLGYSRAADSGTAHLTVRFAPAVHARGVATMEIAYAGRPVFSEDSINGIHPGWVELGVDSYWQPVVEGLTQQIVARVGVVLPPAWSLVASGHVERHGDTLALANDVPLVDVAFTASPALRRNGDARVGVHTTGTDGALVPNVLATAKSCTRYLDARYGAATPLPPAEIVIAPRGGPGYARKNYIVITRVADTATVALQRFICHELAHFWSTGAIAAGPENWLNEAFAELVSARFVREASGDAAYQSILANWRQRSTNTPPIWTPAATRRPGPRVSYGKAPLLLHRLEERVGTPTMDRILVRFMTEPIRTTDRLITMVGEVAGGDTAGWLREELAR